MSAGPLGRLEPTDFVHVEKYPLRALATAERPARVPVIGGFNWYANFDAPIRDGRAWWIGRGDLGAVRGGHAVCFPPVGLAEPYSWWTWFNQVSEGICVSEAIARAMALLNRRRYQPRPTYDWAQRNDEWEGEDYSGTSVRAGLDCARTMGMVAARRGEAHVVERGRIDRPFDYAAGISANRWATSTEEIAEVLGAGGRDYIDLANSWGRGYPRRVRVPLTVVDRLRLEGGEFGIVTDR